MVHSLQLLKCWITCTLVGETHEEGPAKYLGRGLCAGHDLLFKSVMCCGVTEGAFLVVTILCFHAHSLIDVFSFGLTFIIETLEFMKGLNFIFSH